MSDISDNTREGANKKGLDLTYTYTYTHIYKRLIRFKVSNVKNLCMYYLITFKIHNRERSIWQFPLFMSSTNLAERYTINIH